MLNIPSIPNEEFKERAKKVQAAMKKEGYDLPFACAITAATSVIGPIFPPSIPFVSTFLPIWVSFLIFQFVCFG